MSVVDNVGVPYSAYVQFEMKWISHGNIPQANWSKIVSMKAVKTGGDYASGELFTTIDLVIEYRHVPHFYTNLLKYLEESTDGRVRAQIRWGYSMTPGGQPTPSTPMYNVTLVKCEPTNMWNTLNISFVQDEIDKKYTSWKPELKEHLSKKDTKYVNLSDLVSDIAKYQGWEIGKIVPTQPQPTGADGVQDPIKIKSFYMTPIQAINDLIARYANISTTGEMRYVSTVKFTTDKPNGVYYFVPTMYLTNNYGVSKTYEYVIQGLNNGNVIEFTPKFGNIYTDILNPNYTPQSVYNRIQQKPSAINSIPLASMDFIEYTPDVQQSSPKENDNIQPPVSYASYIEQPESRVVSQNFSESSLFIKNYIGSDISKYLNVLSIRQSATMKILGDPTLNAMDYVNVIVLYPATWEVTEPKLHPSSGVYQIISITDEIQDGTYTSTLNLIACDSDKFNFKVGNISNQKFTEYSNEKE